MQSKTCDYAEHRALLVDHLAEVHGPLAGKIADRLLAVGTSTLKELADFIRQKDPFADEPTSVVRGAGAGSAGVLHTPQVPIGSAVKMCLASDREIKFTLATLLQHNVVAYDRNDNSYTVLVGQGLLQFLLPSFIRFVRAELGDAGDVVISLLSRFGKLTLGALRREVLRSVPFAEKGVKEAINYMVAKKWIVACGDSSFSASSIGEEPDEKRHRVEGDNNNTHNNSNNKFPSVALDDTTPYEVSFATLLYAMRAAAISAFAADRFTPLGARIIATMLARDASVIKHRGNTASFDSPSSMMKGVTNGGNTSEEAIRRLGQGFGGAPVLPVLSTSLSVGDLHHFTSAGTTVSSTSSAAAALGGNVGAIAAHPLPPLDASDLSQATFRAKLRELCSEAYGALLQEGTMTSAGAASSSTLSGGVAGAGATAGYILNYNKAAAAMRERLVEKVVFTRYGVVGTRILKLLLEKSAYEDRHIAEECICSLADTREALLGLQRDGYVRQVEVPKNKVDYNAERNPKHSNYLWAANKDVLTVQVRRHLVAAARATRARLMFEYRRLEEQFPAEFAKGVHWLLNGGSMVAVAPNNNNSNNSSKAAGGSAAAPTSAADPTAATSNANSLGITRGSLTPARHEDLLRLRFACRALMTAQMAQMDMILLMDYY